MATSHECLVPPSGVRRMAATQPHRQGGKTVSLSSGYAVAATTGQPGSSNAHHVPVMEENTQLLLNDIESVVSSACLARRLERAEALREHEECRLALLAAAADLDSDSEAESVICHSVDIGSGTESLGQPPPSTAQESLSSGLYLSLIHIP